MSDWKARLVEYCTCPEGNPEGIERMDCVPCVLRLIKEAQRKAREEERNACLRIVMQHLRMPHPHDKPNLPPKSDPSVCTLLIEEKIRRRDLPNSMEVEA